MGVSQAALSIQAQKTTLDLHSLLRKVDPATYRAEWEADARAQLNRIRARIASLKEALQQTPKTPQVTPLSDSLEQLLSALQRAEEFQTASPKQYWAAFLHEVHPAYEKLAAWLRTAHVVCPSLRPTNYYRNLFHVTSALVALGVVALAPSQGFIIFPAACFCLTAWSLEIGRRFSPHLNDRLMRFFGRVAHVHERHRVNSSTWYATALLLLSVFTTPAVSAFSVAVLGIGDPIAALIGRRYGKTPLRAGRSLEGSLAFFCAAFLVSLLIATVALPLGLPQTLSVALAAAAVGALTELFSTHLDDNFTIPIAVAIGVQSFLYFA